MMNLIKISNFGENIKNLVYLPRCSACHTILDNSENALCEQCRKLYKSEKIQICPVCKKMHPFCSCKLHYRGNKYDIIHVTAYSIKRTSVSKNLTFTVKNENDLKAFDFIASEITEMFKLRSKYDLKNKIGKESPENTVFTWIPRSERAKRNAGHDQGKEIALRVAKNLNTGCKALFESKSEKSQKTLSRKKRLENAERSYSLACDEKEIRSKNIVIIDDIITSGSTLGVCADKVMKAGAKSVLCAVFAKTDTDKGVTEETYSDYFDR